VAPKRRASLGFSVRTGRAVVVAIGGPLEEPEIMAKVRIDVATTFDEGAVFHVAQELPLEKARAFVSDSEARFVARARTALVAFVAELDAKVVAAAMAAPGPKSLPPIESILKAHPLLHAAEGELYRRVFTEAATAVGPRPHRLPPDTLEKSTAQTVGLAPARLAAQLAAMGKAAGRPWAADQKRAALAAWSAMARA
jgi:hypothetical protein